MPFAADGSCFAPTLKRAGKFTAMHCNPIDYAKRMEARGFSLRTVANDSRFIALAAQELFRQLKPAKA